MRTQAARWEEMHNYSARDKSISFLRGFPSNEIAEIKRISPHPSATTVIWSRERNGFQASYSEHEAPLSVHCVFRGNQLFSIGRRPNLLLDQSAYLILNDGQSYVHAVEGTPELESLTILFSVNLVEETFSPEFSGGDVLQFDCSSKNRLPVQFCERLRQNDNIVTPRLLRLRALLADSAAEEVVIVDELKIILRRMLHVHRDDVFAAEALPYQRSSTKLQMYDRLQRARDYIASALDEDWNLPNMSETVGFSPYHFQRCFTQMFGETPHQFLTNCRLNKASLMLRVSEKSVTQICGEVGFESLGSFSTLFCQRYGMSPIRFRNTGSDFSINSNRS
ncbi:MAG: AraC family transcriptional regulator [Candidatus Melainabacteria bacterium]|nr:AraC family transcriptional regulator [Candidatus Melainabacteria bacterium]